MGFLEKMDAVQNNISTTENGAIGLATSGKVLTDFFFMVSSFRNLKESELIKRVVELIKSKDPYILKLLFYIRDVREGLGERRLFRIAMKTLCRSGKLDDQFFIDTITTYIPMYGRYDDILVFLDTQYQDVVIDFIKKTLKEDLKALNNKKSVSLMAKWLPSNNTSSEESRQMAHLIATKLGLSARDYRKTLSKLRHYIDVVERKMCAKQWGDINYNTVPSKANLLYGNAFLRNDEQRRREYLAKLSVGDKSVKINAATNYPHDIVAKYSDGAYYSVRASHYNETYEQLWKNLPDVEGLKNTIVVRDGSGSMTSPIGGTSVTALHVSTALAIYCAERLEGEFKDKFITFSSRPGIRDLSECGSLQSKLNLCYKEDDCSNTDIEKVFHLILATAKQNKLSQEELPAQILIISDMEFDEATTTLSQNYDTLFDTIARKYHAEGYKMPKLVFWNVYSRTGTIPCKENDQGVLLISGFSQNVINMVNTGEVDPYKAIINALSVDRYIQIPLYMVEEAEDCKSCSIEYTSPLEE